MEFIENYRANWEEEEEEKFFEYPVTNQMGENLWGDRTNVGMGP
jgi:hypothetical protein